MLTFVHPLSAFFFALYSVRTLFYPPPPLRALPSVKLGSLTLMRHKMTFSHFSKDLIRPLSQRDSMLARCLRRYISARQ